MKEGEEIIVKWKELTRTLIRKETKSKEQGRRMVKARTKGRSRDELGNSRGEEE